MWAFLVLTFALAVRASDTNNDTAVEEKLNIARGKLLTVPVKKMKADEISSLLDSLGFYKRSQKGEEVPEEFQHFPLRTPRDEL
ncbi:hypothetical protein FQN60_018005 [Etheostoma spectabile]|uniref:Selenoprotein F/M domain-containing protein n=1 Tax=Etheostoma spectabile TaxID=54343 RepID=A0A5J5DH64_9PERO|nr:hypothetical protein FQN60_018005 [Etheostoma spectabile]